MLSEKQNDKNKSIEVNREYFEIHISPKELLFVLFSKKICPKCGTKLIRKKKIEIIEDVERNFTIDYCSNTKVNLHDIKIVYKCNRCMNDFTVSELLNF